MSTSARSHRPVSSLSSLPPDFDLTPATTPKPRPPRAEQRKPTLAQRWESFIRVRQEYSLSQVRPSFFASAPGTNKPSASSSAPARGTKGQGKPDIAMTASKGKSKARRSDAA